MLRARTRRELVREEIEEPVWLPVGPETCNNPPMCPRIKDRQEVKKAAETKHQKEEGKDITHFPLVAEDREPEGTGMN